MAQPVNTLNNFNPGELERPDSSLLKYYALISLLTGPGIVAMFLPLFFKYETLRYKFEDDGMSMSWGILFRHEIHLTYRRIQDIHLSRKALLIAWLAITAASFRIGLLLAPLALAVMVLPDIVAYVAIHLRYDTTWYVLTHRSLRIRRGIWVIHETTITFENVQNVSRSEEHTSE